MLTSFGSTKVRGRRYSTVSNCAVRNYAVGPSLLFPCPWLLRNLACCDIDMGRQRICIATAALIATVSRPTILTIHRLAGARTTRARATPARTSTITLSVAINGFLGVSLFGLPLCGLPLRGCALLAALRGTLGSGSRFLTVSGRAVITGIRSSHRQRAFVVETVTKAKVAAIVVVLLVVLLVILDYLNVIDSLDGRSIPTVVVAMRIVVVVIFVFVIFLAIMMRIVPRGLPPRSTDRIFVDLLAICLFVI